jgi:hypothetical protein
MPTISPALWFAINTLISTAIRRLMGELEDLTEEEIITMAKTEEARSNELAERDKHG